MDADEIGRGVVSGLTGTAVMTAAMAALRAAGWLEVIEPRRLSASIERSAGVRRRLSRPAFEASWTAQHFAYGAAAGATYECAWRRTGLPEPFAAGATYGVALWTLGYAGWAPALGFAPPPTAKPARHVAAMIGTHLIYGVTAAAVARRLRSP